MLCMYAFRDKETLCDISTVLLLCLLYSLTTVILNLVRMVLYSDEKLFIVSFKSVFQTVLAMYLLVSPSHAKIA